MPHQTAALQDDVIINQLALQAAEVQAATRLIANGFLGSLAYGDDNDNNDNDINEQSQLEEEKLLASSGDLDGVGYIPPPATSSSDQNPLRNDPRSRESSAATERLRKQLLGKRASKTTGLGSDRLRSISTPTSKRGQHNSNHPQKRKYRKNAGGSDDDEDGRSNISKAKTSKTTKHSELPGPKSLNNASNDTGNTVQTSDGKTPAATPKKRGSSYLDEVLEQRAAKKKKKTKKKEEEEGSIHED